LPFYDGMSNFREICGRNKLHFGEFKVKMKKTWEDLLSMGKS